MLWGSNLNEVEIRIRGTAAYAECLLQNAEAGLALLQGLSHPEATKRRLQILLEAERFGDAANLIREQRPDSGWVDRAVAALVANGEKEKAKKLIEWAAKECTVIVWQRCILRYVQRAYHSLFRSKAGQLRPDAIGDAEASAFRDFLATAEPILATVREREQAATGLEAEVAMLAVHAHGLLGEKSESGRLGVILAKRMPIPLDLAPFAMLGYFAPPENFATRLRVEHPKQFQAKLFAASVEAKLFNRGSEGFEAALKLAEEANTPEEQEDLCKVLVEIAQSLGPQQMQKVEQIAPTLLKSDDRFLKTIRIIGLLRTGNLSEAKSLLEETKNESDPYWLQAHANYLISNGNANAAVDELNKAAGLISHPIVLARLAALAFKENRLKDARPALERLLIMDSEDADARHDLAMIYTRQAEWAKAADQFAKLRQLKPEERWYGLNQANALIQGGDLKGALRVYEELCKDANPRLEVILGRANLLRQLDDAPTALDELRQFRDRFWEFPEFVAAYMDIGYAADKESEAHEAFLQMLALRRRGKVASEMLQEKSIDEVIEYYKQERERAERASEFVLQGKMPWLMADSLLGIASYWGWRLRTQAMSWVAEEPGFWAQRCIYATNGFKLSGNVAEPRLSEIDCPAPGSPVVIDLSAMITLHHLGLLTEAATFFGRILYPTSYQTLRLYENERLVRHQPSRHRALNLVKKALDEKRIAVVQEGDVKDLIPVKEHTPDEDPAHYYRLIDILPVLTEMGLGGDQILNAIRSVAHRQTGVNESHPRLEPAAKILADDSTLETLSQIGALELLLKAFQVHLTQTDVDSIMEAIRSFQALDEVRQAYHNLWDIINNDSRFAQALHTPPADYDAEHSGKGREESLSAVFLAQQEKLPLLADDRVTQQMLLARWPEVTAIAFGSDRLVVALAQKGAIPWTRAAELILKLMELRYRFVVPPSKVLKLLADRFKSNPPSEELRKAAQYVHDCMRDPGLFAGLEKSNPPTSMAFRLYFSWVSAVATFVAEVWIDESYTNQQAERVTIWATRELLPSPPLNMGPASRLPADVTNRLLFQSALWSLCVSDRYDRGNACLKAIAQGCGVAADDLRTIVLQVIDEA